MSDWQGPFWGFLVIGLAPVFLFSYRTPRTRAIDGSRA